MELVLMSIKPGFGDAILDGRKRAELRRMVNGPITPGDLVVLYLSSPRKAIEGFFKAKRVYIGRRSELMRIADGLGDLGLREGDWGYVDEDREGMMIIVDEPRRCPRPITLDQLMGMVKGFKPPLSYIRLRPNDDLYWVIFKRCLEPILRSMWT
jgi:predicted transcriptional regulator